MRVPLRHKDQSLVVELRPEGDRLRVLVDDQSYTVEAHSEDDHTLLLVVDGQRHRVSVTRSGRDRLVSVAGESYRFAPESSVAARDVATLVQPEIVAPMPGKVLQVLVQAGDHVESGAGLLILEAMKMENRLLAEASATVAEVRVADGDMVEGGQVLIVLSYDQGSSP
jgi:biotin carboxyl carrier protein